MGLWSQSQPHPRVYTCYQSDSIHIDGLLNEEDWNSASWTDYFIDIEGPEKSKPFEQTRVKMLWNNDFLFIGAYIETKHIWARLTKNESIIYHDDDFEIFIDPDGDTHNYAELEFNANGAMMDILLNKPYRAGGEAMFGWNCRDLRYAISYRGSLNMPSDTDTSWTIEIAIPMQSMVDLPGIRKPPVTGDFWRINFSRVDWDVEIKNGKYLKLPDKAEHNWVWSPQWTINMHKPEFWGYLVFIEEKASKQAIRSFSDPYWQEKNLLFALFDAELRYYGKHKEYCSDPQLLIPGFNPRQNKISIEVIHSNYIITLRNDTKTFFLNNESRLWSE